MEVDFVQWCTDFLFGYCHVIWPLHLAVLGSISVLWWFLHCCKFNILQVKEIVNCCSMISYTVQWIIIVVATFLCVIWGHCIYPLLPVTFPTGIITFWCDVREEHLQLQVMVCTISVSMSLESFKWLLMFILSGIYSVEKCFRSFVKFCTHLNRTL
jgi:hypothetical protein